MEEENFRNYEEGENYMKFYSNAVKPYYNLSNFVLVDNGIEVFGEIFPTVEHVYQSLKFCEESAKRFTIEGDIGNINNIDEPFNLLFGENYESKKKYWMKKGMFGIVAQMAGKKENFKKLGLKPKNDFVSTWEIWKEILIKKYEKDKYKNILLFTDDLYLLEYSRSSKKHKNYWGGLIDDNENKLYGENTMGKYLMKIRDILRNDL